MRRQAVGIRDLARELGMSISTVSRAMNARPDVSPETQRLVRETAERLGYTPNQSGRSLRQGTTDTVALVMPTHTARTESGETFFLNVSDGLQEVLSPRGLNLVILPCGSAEQPDEFLFKAVDRHLADAIVLADTQRVDRRIDYLIEKKVPFVGLGRTEAGGYSWLDLDFEGVAAQSVDRLVGLGHRRIALGTTDRTVNNTFLFLDSYRASLERHGIGYDPELVIRVPDTRQGGYHLAARLLAAPHRPTAVILEQETLAIGLYRALADAGLTPGRDLAVIGFRENPVLDLLTPSLTCFRVSLTNYGRRLGHLVLAEMARAGSAGPLTQEVWPMELVSGDSDGAPLG
ncbi:substrate-binding domain-containing protein [Goodfellowiella coeruleoviolacea]|uniref:substrate-binding domain-containing protein n=1 Tax=Goodfellowiella coeruleoviolacea TaxID=334858 RepID=UPI0020A37B34|nr:substrate-binding domain-containing protein [Goodfellowiella coeruleoviolacea]